MSEPKIADTKPIVVELEAGKKYFYCTCGYSAKQPFCDGAHSAKQLFPQAFVAEKDGPAHVCACKRSKNAPFCDGTHRTITQ